MFGLFKRNKKKKQNIADCTPMTASLDFSDEISIGNAQHSGAREYQEDSFGISDTAINPIKEKGVFAVLADGMGGLANGKAVSQKTVSSLLEWFNSPYNRCDHAEDIKNAVVLLNREICQEYNPNGRINSGTTLVCTLIKDGILHWLCVGDSRIYLKRDEKIYQINEDHDYLNQLLDKVTDNSLSLDKAFGDVQKDSLAECIGKPDLNKYDFSKRGFALNDDDIIILCSDGVYNAISDAELCAMANSDTMTSCENIKNEIISRSIPCQDNNTIIIISYKKKGENHEKN